MTTPNFEKEIQALAQKLEDDKYAQAFYTALCNTAWRKLNTNYIYSCTWRYAGGLVASMRYKGEDYLDFYCSGNEGKVREDIEKDLNALEYIRIQNDMEVKISKIDIGGVLTLPPNWKGYSFNEETDSWIKDSDLYKDEKGNLYPFCSTIRTNRIVEIFENAPINESNILIIRKHIDNTSMNGYILVGNVNIKNYKFETKLID